MMLVRSTIRMPSSAPAMATILCFGADDLGRIIVGDAMYPGHAQTEIPSVGVTARRLWFSNEIPWLRCCGMLSPIRRFGTRTTKAAAQRIVDGGVKTGGIGRRDAKGYPCMLDRADRGGGVRHPDPPGGETPCAMIC